MFDELGCCNEMVIMFFFDYGMLLLFVKMVFWYYSIWMLWIVSWLGVMEFGEWDDCYMILVVDMLLIFLEIV